MTTSILLWCTAVLALLSAGTKMYRARGAWTPGGLFLCAAVACVGVSAGISSPATQIWFSHFEPFANMGRLVANSLGMCAALCVHGLVAHLVHSPDKARRSIRQQAFVLVLAIAAMTLLLAGSGVGFDPSFVNLIYGNPGIAGYAVIFAGYIGWALASFVWSLNRYIRQTTRPWLRAGLRVVQTGAAIGIVWSVWKAGQTMAQLTNAAPLSFLNPISTTLVTSCVSLVAIGAAIPMVAAPVQWMRRYRSYRALGPLWRPLHGALPQISLPHALAHGRWSVLRNISFARYRRMIEILDARLLLRPYVHPDAAEWALDGARENGLADDRAQCVVEAATLAAALEAHHASHRYVDEPLPSGTPQRPDADAEASWLAQVAREYTDSAIVADVRSRVRAELSPAES